MSPERMKQSGRSHKPRRVGHQSGSYPEPGWHKGHRQQICLHSKVVWVPSESSTAPFESRTSSVPHHTTEPLAGADEAALEGS